MTRRSALSSPGSRIRDSRDLLTAVAEIRRITSAGGRFGFCDLGKPDSFASAVLLGFYLRVGVPIIGAVTGGRRGFRFGSLYDTYLLTLKNGELTGVLRKHFSEVELKSSQLGGAIKVFCTA